MKKRSWTRVLSMLLCLLMVAGLLPTTLAAEPVDNTETEWEEVQEIISQYYGEWTEPTYPGAVNNRIPNTALLGNGDVGIMSAGSATTKSFNISKSDFWEATGTEKAEKSAYGYPLKAGTVSIGETPEDDGSLAKGYKTLTTSSGKGESAVNGRGADPSQPFAGWVSDKGDQEPWLALEFEEAITFNYWEIYNYGFYQSGNTSLNTSAADLQISENGTEWNTVSTVTNASGSRVWQIQLEDQVTTRFVRLVIKQSSVDGGDAARIGQFRLYLKEVTGEESQDLARGYEKVTASSTHEQLTPDRAVNGQWNDNTQYEGWTSTVGKPQWLKLDMGEDITFNRWVVRNDGAGRPNETANNTKDCELQISATGGDSDEEWETVSSVKGNSANVIQVDLDTPVTARYIRLYLTTPTQETTSDSKNNPRARVGAFELYNVEETDVNVNLIPRYEQVSASTHHEELGPERAVNGKWNADTQYEGWVSAPGAPQWLAVDMGEEITFNRWILRNDGAGRPNEGKNNTYDCLLQTSQTGDPKGEWTTVHEIQENTENVIQVDFDEPITAQYIRVYITQGTIPGGDGRCRIGALELYNMDGTQEPEEPEEPQEPQVDYHEVEDILNAEIRTTQELAGIPMEIKSWMSATEDVFVMEVTSLAENTSGPVSVMLETTPTSGARKADSYVSDDGKYIIVTRESDPGTVTDNGLEFTTKVAMVTKVIGADYRVFSQTGSGMAEISLTLEPGQTIYVVTSIGGGGRVYDGEGNLWENRQEPAVDALALQEKLTDVASVEALHEKHLDWWKEYWLQSYISLDTSNKDLNTLQKYYYAAQYELGSSIREGDIASGLYGIWHSTDSASWHSDFHLNYNFISTYYGVATSNRPELLIPAVDALVDYLPQGKANAGSTEMLKSVYEPFVEELIEKGQVDPVNGIQDAILYPVSIGPWGMTLEYLSFLKETVNAPFSAYPMIEYYNFTQDEAFMEDTLYPYLKLVNNFLEHWLVEEPEGSGQYTLYAGYNEGSWAKNPAVELAVYKNCLRYGIELSEKLGVDADKRATWQKLYDGMADQPIVENYNGSGKTVLSLAEEEWRGGSWHPMESPVPGDGNCIPLEAVIPGEVFGYYSTDEELEILQNTVEVFSDRGGWTQINNFPKLSPVAVNCRYDAEVVAEKLAAAIRSHMKANMMIDDGVHGIEKAGATEAINNMMLLEDKGVIKLFGNWLENENAKFVHLRAPGAFVFSAEYDGTAGEIVEGVTMYSEAGATATVASLWEEGMTVRDSKGNVVAVTKGTAPNHPEETTYTFNTVKGETYTFTMGESEPEPTTYTVTFETNGGNEIAAVEVENGKTLALPENPTKEGYIFAGWFTDVELKTAFDDSKPIEADMTLYAKWTANETGGGTVTTPSYTITVTQATGGKISPSTTSVTKGSDKTFTITANEGYKISDVLVDGKSVGAVSTYTFENVTARHTITAKFEKVEEVTNVGGFTDVKSNDWFADAVQYVVDEGLMNGTSSDKFTPNGDTTRGMIVTILYRQAGSPAVESDGKTWWSDARVWAMSNGISDGTNMDKEITREQLATMLYRYAELKGEDVSKSTSLDTFKDGDQVSTYAVEALEWAAAEGIVTGKTGGIIDPQAGATRAETATMLMRFCELTK